MEKKARKSPERQTVKYEAFAHIAKALDISPADLVEATGQVRGVAATWAKRGWVTKTTYLAAEGLLRRSRKKAASSAILLVTVPMRKLQLFQELASGLSFKVTNISEAVWDE